MVLKPPGIPERRTNLLQRGIFQAIMEERERQRLEIAAEDEDRQRPPEDWVGIIQIWLGKAAQETNLYRGGAFSAEMFKRRIVQIAAICVAALEALDGRT